MFGGDALRLPNNCDPGSELDGVGFALAAADELFPQAVGRLAQEKIGLRVEYVPQAAPHFLVELARCPEHHAGEEARLLRLRLDDAVDDSAIEGEIDPGHELQRAAAWILRVLHHGEDHLRPGRAAEIDRIDDLLRRRVLGEELAERDGGRLVDDEADVARVADRLGDEVRRDGGTDAQYAPRA